MMRAAASPGSGRSPIRSRARTTRRAGSRRCRTVDALAIQKEALELVAGFPGARKRRRARAGRGAAAHRRALEPVLAQLTQQYTQNYQKSTDVESRLWHSVFDLVKAFIAAYQRVAQGRLPARRQQALARDPAVGPRAPRALPRARRQVTGCSATATGFPRSGASSTSSTSSRACAAGSASSSCYGAGAFAQPGVSFEQEYLKTLLLMRLDSGNFTPDQVEWVARQLDDWTPSLTLVPPPRRRRGFFVDLTGTQGLRRRDKPQRARAACCCSTPGPCTRASSSSCAGCPSRTTTLPKPGELPAREQRLLLMRLASLFGPDAIAQAPRAHALRSRRRGARRRRPAGADARDRRDRPPARTPARIRRRVAASYDEVTQMMNPSAEPGIGRAAHSRHELAA